MLAAMADAGEPVRLSTRQLLRTPLEFSPAVCGPVVFVTANTALVAAAADRLGPRSWPLLCAEGQPKSALHLLLGGLRQAGIVLRYHGDFDWKGLEIANLLARRHGVQPWRMHASDYLAKGGRLPLVGAPVACDWDEELPRVMVERGTALHEEEVMEDLLADMRRV
jgi:uncharacterized protein (TIGR02679 family)